MTKEMRCVVILTSGRTGSSAVAGVLYHLGIDMGKWRIKDNNWRLKTFNPRGQFEDSLFTGFSRDYLSSRGGGWDKPWVKKLNQPTELELGRFEKIIKGRSKKSSLWGWKNPRTVLFIESFIHLLPNPIFIHSARGRDATIASIQRRHSHWSQKRCERVHDFYAARLDKFAKRHKTLTVRYERLTENPKREVTRLAKAVGVPVTEKAVDFIDPELRHF